MVPWHLIEQEHNPDIAWDIWQHMFLDIADSHAPLKKKRVKGTSSPWITPELKRLMFQRDKLKKLASRFPTDGNWTSYKHMKNKVNYEIKNAKMNYYNAFFKDNRRNIKNTWKGINRLIGNEPKFNKITQLDTGDTVNTDPIEISNILNTHFSTIGPSLASEIKDTSSNFTDFIIPAEHIFNLAKVSCQEVFNLIQKIPNNKASGLDNISARLLKEASPIVTRSLTFIINQSITTGIFPNAWKRAKVTPIFKEDLRTDPNNYRPISVLPVMSAHLDPMAGDCEEMEVPCPLTQIGCSETKTMKLQERRIHEESASAGHVMLLFQSIMQLFSVVGRNLQGSNQVTVRELSQPSQEELEKCVKQVENALKENKELKSKVVQQENRIRQLEGARQGDPVIVGSASTGQESTRELSRRIDNEEAKTSDLEVLIFEGNMQNEDLQRQVSTLARGQESFKESINRLQRQFESISHSLALRNVTLSDLEEYVRQQDVSSHDGILLWKISNFTRRRQDALSGNQVSFYSPFFFTSRYGYKMCARIYLNGDGIGKGTHISIFFVVMRGQYDALLRWPFRQKVTFMLLDQDNVEHVIDAFRPDPNSSSFQRPRRETNIASGCPTFCPLSELNNHAYVRDDTMFLKIIVDTTDL